MKTKLSQRHSLHRAALAVIERIEARAYYSVSPSISGIDTVQQGSNYVLRLHNDGSAATSWSVNWGDGTSQVVSGSTTALVHAFATTGSVSISASAADDNGTYNAPANIALAVNSTSGGGSGSAGPFNTDHNHAITVDLTDESDQALTIASFDSPAHGTLSMSGNGTITYTPNGTFVGTDTFKYTTSTGSGTASIDVTNDLPQPEDSQVSLTYDNFIATSNEDGIPTSGTGWSPVYSHDSTLYYNVLVGQLSLPTTDADGDTLTYTVANGPSHGTLTFDPSTGLFIEELQASFQGYDHFTYTVSDGLQTSAPINVSIALNVSMVAQSVRLQYSDWVLTLNALADQNSMQVADNASPEHGYAEIDNRDMLYLPTDSGPDDRFNIDWTFLGLQAKAINVVMQQSPVNAAGGVGLCPISLVYTVSNNIATSFSSSATNLYDFGDSLTLTIIDGPTHGSLVLGLTGGLTYTPTSSSTAEYRGWDFAYISVSDGTNAFSQWIQFNVGLN